MKTEHPPDIGVDRMGQRVVNENNKLIAVLRDRTGRDVEVRTAGLDKQKQKFGIFMFFTIHQ